MDDRDGTWENPYYGFSLTLPQAQVLWKRLLLAELSEEEGEVLDKVLRHLAKFIDPGSERMEGREKLRALGMLLSLPSVEENGERRD